jgi:hypothetical protein
VLRFALRLTLLAPDIVETILGGRRPESPLSYCLMTCSEGRGSIPRNSYRPVSIREGLMEVLLVRGLGFICGCLDIRVPRIA